MPPFSFGTAKDVILIPIYLLVPDGREELLPIADIVTPNLREASALLGGVQLDTVADMCSAAKSIHAMGPRLVFPNELIIYLFFI